MSEISEVIDECQPISLERYKTLEACMDFLATRKGYQKGWDTWMEGMVEYQWVRDIDGLVLPVLCRNMTRKEDACFALAYLPSNMRCV